ncbi:MAG: hypothetical protein K2V38_20435 [Gemmataceae bacterium]|nr:hypothetical protein [Gemmataceae bacterium]
MLHRRSEPETDESPDRTGEYAAYETARSAANPGKGEADKGDPPKKDEEHISVFWRVFGGTILSIVALVAITLYNNMSTSITELRNELSREREARAELVKKDEFNTRITTQYERIRVAEAVKVDVEGLREKVNTNAAAVDAARKDAAATAEVAKRDATTLELLKERIALLEALKKDLASLDALKEKLATTAADLKVARDDVQKLSAEVERNKASDLERKTLRDTQHKQLEDTLKELQKGLQDCREKLARLEGAQPKVPADVPLPFRPRPADGFAKPDEK